MIVKIRSVAAGIEGARYSLERGMGNFWGDENVPHLDWGDSYMGIHIYLPEYINNCIVKIF